jgi:1-phosphatidylinositol-4-phosphate 5-kinase
MVDPFHSLDPVDNIEQIKKFKGPDGGKSGEFFFFSNDNKLIIKTLSDQELKAFKERIHYYAYHILSNEDSMISLIYGLFTF